MKPLLGEGRAPRAASCLCPHCSGTKELRRLPQAEPCRSRRCRGSGTSLRTPGSHPPREVTWGSGRKCWCPGIPWGAACSQHLFPGWGLVFGQSCFCAHPAPVPGPPFPTRRRWTWVSLVAGAALLLPLLEPVLQGVCSRLSHQLPVRSPAPAPQGTGIRAGSMGLSRPTSCGNEQGAGTGTGVGKSPRPPPSRGGTLTLPRRNCCPVCALCVRTVFCSPFGYRAFALLPSSTMPSAARIS